MARTARPHRPRLRRARDPDRAARGPGRERARPQQGAAGLPLRRQGRPHRLQRPPAAGDAKDVQPKRMGANFIENSELPIAAQQAMERYPVTLYTFACGELARTPRRCSTARRAVHDGQRRGSERCGAAEEPDRRAQRPGAAGRRQADRQGLQRAALDGAARPGGLPEGAGVAPDPPARPPAADRRPTAPARRSRPPRAAATQELTPPPATTAGRADAARRPVPVPAGAAASRRARGRTRGSGAAPLSRPRETRHLERQLAEGAPAARARLARAARRRTCCACRKPSSRTGISRAGARGRRLHARIRRPEDLQRRRDAGAQGRCRRRPTSRAACPASPTSRSA